jgi:hypothetical protein
LWSQPPRALPGLIHPQISGSSGCALFRFCSIPNSHASPAAATVGRSFLNQCFVDFLGLET